jgi:hypothetical protein
VPILVKMAVGRAFAVAFGLAFLVLCGLFVMFRSGLAAQRLRENPASPRLSVWLIVHRSLPAFMVALTLGVGTFLLIYPASNVVVRAGVGTLAYAQALLMARHVIGVKPWVLRTAWSVNVLGGLLCSVGSALHGGAIGIVGVTLSLAFSAFWLWLLRAIWRA